MGKRTRQSLTVSLVMAVFLMTMTGPARASTWDRWDYAKGVVGALVAGVASQLGAAAVPASVAGFVAAAAIDVEERLRPHGSQIRRDYGYNFGGNTIPYAGLGS